MGKGVEGIRAAGTERTRVNGHEGNVLGERLLGGGVLGCEGLLGEGGFLGGCNSGFEVAVDADVNVLIETGIRLETGFRFGASFDYMEIMMEETKSPFNAFRRVVVFESVSEFLGGFDEFAVSDAGCRPSLGEMVGIELVETAKTRNTADDDVLAVLLTLLVGIHHSAVISDAINGVQIAHTTGVNLGNSGRRHLLEKGAC